MAYVTVSALSCFHQSTYFICHQPVMRDVNGGLLQQVVPPTLVIWLSERQRISRGVEHDGDVGPIFPP